MNISIQNKEIEAVICQLSEERRTAIAERALMMFFIAQSKSNVDLADSRTTIRLWIRPNMAVREQVISR